MRTKLSQFVIALSLFCLINSARQTVAETTPSPTASSEPKTRSVTYNINGKEVTRYFTLQKDSSGSYRVVETTGPGGKTITETNDLTKTNTGFKVDSTVTGPHGKEAASSYEWIMNSMGYERVGSATGPNGKTVTSDKNVTKTGTGWEGVNTITGPDGQQYVVNSSGSHGDGSREVDHTVTGPNGEQVVRVDTWQKTDTGYERVTTTTGPKGGETTRTRDVSHEGNNVTINQDRTLKRANGESVTPEQVRKARESNPALDAKIGRTERLARTGRALNAPSTGVGQNRLARRAAAAESNAAPAPANAPETIEGKPALERSGEAPSAAGAKRHRRAGGAGRR